MYTRNTNTTTRGGAFDSATIVAVWRKGKIVPGHDANVVRKDACGVWMKFADYGNTGTYGWEIDHIHPVAKGGGDELSNLQPLQWQNNRGKSDNFPQWFCTLRAA